MPVEDDGALPCRGISRSRMIMPLVLKGTWHQVDLLDHTRPELPEGLERPLAVREQVTPRGFAHGPDRSVAEAAAKPFLRDLQACHDARHRQPTRHWRPAGRLRHELETV